MCTLERGTGKLSNKEASKVGLPHRLTKNRDLVRSRAAKYSLTDTSVS